MCTNSYNESTSALSIPASKNELVDNLFLVIQNIVAEEANVSMKTLSENCIEWKIVLSSSYPVIILQYELKRDQNEGVQMIPVVDYKEMDEVSGTGEESESSVTFHERRENYSPSCNLEQEVPELLLVLSNDEEIDNKSKKNKQTKVTSAERNISTGQNLHPMNNLSEIVSSSNGRELIAVTALHSNMGILQTEKVNENCDDERQRKKSEGIGSDNRISQKKRNVKIKHKSICTDEKPCIFEQSKYFTPSPNLVELKNITTGNLSQDVRFDRKSVNEQHASEQHFTDSPNAAENSKTRNGGKCFTCEECGKSYTQSRYLRRHKKIHAGQIFTCDFCGKTFATSNALICHKRIHTGEKPFKCGECGKSFTFSSNLVCHKRIHTDKKPFKCEVCGKFFKDSTYLYRHKKSHTGIKPFKCDVCDKSFKTSTELIVHQRTHTGEKPFQCDACGKFCTTSSHLVAHRRMHTDEKPFKCDICGECFKYSSNLNYHKKTHTGVKPFKCDICGKSFKTSNELTVHKRFHSGEKPFQCDICDKSFTTLGQRISHKRTHTGEKAFKSCEICGKLLSSAGSLCVHKKRHTRVKCFTCKYCGKSFPLRSHLDKHHQTHC